MITDNPLIKATAGRKEINLSNLPNGDYPGQWSNNSAVFFIDADRITLDLVSGPEGKGKCIVHVPHFREVMAIPRQEVFVELLPEEWKAPEEYSEKELLEVYSRHAEEINLEWVGPASATLNDAIRWWIKQQREKSTPPGVV